MKRILAVDDDEDVLYTLQAIGEVGSFEVVPVNNGMIALELINKERFDLIMVDYHMPALNGVQLVKEVRALNQNIPILVLTVDESLELAKKFIDSGATDFAVKPIKAADLICRIKLHLSLTHEQDQKDDITSEIPKGMSRTTLNLILDYLKTRNKAETINEISAETNLAYQTVHRYLEYLLEVKQVELFLVYGNVGRPIHKYHLKR